MAPLVTMCFELPADTQQDVSQVSQAEREAEEEEEKNQISQPQPSPQVDVSSPTHSTASAQQDKAEVKVLETAEDIQQR
ncbi:unnamed protein product [Orchesella dallaii]|uniref:Uncharacterized protein n=1 Tax=Orchesella dallaii TaxID=48710 RepID=A0ABP1R904_9HEXA